jgi:hypothetical protein
MVREPYDVIASLGRWCAPAWNIREYYGVTKATPFDWWITTYQSTLSVLSANFEDVLQLQNMELFDSPSPRASVLCRRHGILHHHDFPREGDSGTADGYHAATPIVDDFSSHIEAAQQKFAFILNRFRSDVQGARVLMVRHEIEQFDDLGANMLSLYDAFVDCFSPRDIDLLVLDGLSHPSEIREASRGRIIIEPLGENADPANDYFWHRNYVRVFDTFGASLSVGPRTS